MTPTARMTSAILITSFASAAQTSVIVDIDRGIRVTAISPTLVRIEPKGPQGFEDRTTFMVVQRDMSQALNISRSTTTEGVLLTTSAYSVLLRRSPGAAASAGPSFVLRDASGTAVHDSDTADASRANLLHWPSPLATAAYALVDRPRFFAPSWGCAPAPAGAAYADTNGYDFANDVSGDTYLFLLGGSLSSWQVARRAFLALAGATPLLPDYAYGTWFTWWHSYTEAEAQDDLAHWEAGQLPLDLWGLDMNWRNTSSGQERYYDHPNTALFPDWKEWLGFLRAKGLRTYFNDHPFPVASRDAGGLQTSKEEVGFRYGGLASWLRAGLTFWWFDHNWAFSIPPPQLNTSRTSGVWQGLDNAAWGSHVYYSVVAAADRARAAAERTRPLALTKFGLPDWRPGMAYEGAAESPAQHRYPVWWTGDGVSLQASIESMVDGGVHGFKPFVHSDCGGDYRSDSAGDLLRWTAHCALGSILRFHGADHRPWTYGAAAEATVKSYLDMRYRLMPSLIAAGRQATAEGTPLVARCDLLWPEHPEAASNLQYLFLNETLLAPIYDTERNLTTRPVWIPPGRWVDAWNGSVVTGPASLSATLPYERVPMWHKADGGLVLAVDEPATRVADQDWSTITLHAFPALHAALTTRKMLHERGDDDGGARTRLVMQTFGDGRTVRLQISRREVTPAGDAASARGWRLRLQLPPMATEATPPTATIDGAPAAPALLLPSAGVATPFGSRGARPAAGGAAVLELEVPPGTQPRIVEVQIGGAPSVESAAA